MAELCARARKLGIATLVDAAQSAGHCPVDVQQMGCDFLAFSGHKTCGPTGIGVLYGRHELLEAMPPWQGGGEMILSVDFYKTSYKHAPHKFEAGTPDISGPIGLHAAMDYLDGIGRENIFRHDQELAAYAYEQLSRLNDIRLFGPKTGRAGVVSFLLKDVHAHDVVTVADQRGTALRGGHHCTQPLMRKLGIESTVAANLVVVFLSPNIVIPPRPSKQAATLLAAIAVYCFPFFVGLVELVLYRISAERAVSYLALGLSFLWLLGAIDAAATLWSDWSFE